MGPPAIRRCHTQACSSAPSQLHCSAVPPSRSSAVPAPPAGNRRPVAGKSNFDAIHLIGGGQNVVPCSEAAGKGRGGRKRSTRTPACGKEDANPRCRCVAKAALPTLGRTRSAAWARTATSGRFAPPHPPPFCPSHRCPTPPTLAPPCRSPSAPFSSGTCWARPSSRLPAPFSLAAGSFLPAANTVVSTAGALFCRAVCPPPSRLPSQISGCRLPAFGFRPLSVGPLASGLPALPLPVLTLPDAVPLIPAFPTDSGRFPR